MNRFTIFSHLKQAIEHSHAFFYDSSFNPLDVMISPIYIEIINRIDEKKHPQITELEQSSLRKAKSYAQIKLRPLKHLFVYKHRVNSRFPSNSILFFPVDITHTIQFEPVWSILRDKEIPYIVVTNKKNVYKSIKEKKQNAILISSLQQISKKESYKKFVEAVNQFLNCDFFEKYKNNRLHHAMNEVIYKGMAGVWNMSEQINQLLDKFSPCCVIPGYDITPEGRLLAFLARNRNIPSYCIMHGSITGEPLDTMHIVDYFCLFGEASKRDLIAKGVDPAPLIVTGAPYLDKFDNIKSGIHPILKHNLSLAESKTYFFIATSGPGHSTSHAHFQLILENIFEAAARYPDAQWVIKMHRKDRIENYREVLSRYKNHGIYIIEHNATGFPESIFEWLQGATALFTGTSTVALEAMSMGIPVVTMDFMDEYKMVDFIDLNTTIHVTDRETLISVIEKLTETPHVFESINERAKAYAAQYFYKSETSASENIVNHITSNIKTPGKCVE